MLKYLITRILIFIPTFFVISLVTFALSKMAPGDPVESMLNSSGGRNNAGQNARGNSEKAYRALWRDLGFDQPTFYFDITNGSQPDTLHRIPKKEQREMLERLSFEFGDWALVSNYYQVARRLEIRLDDVPKTDETARDLIKVKNLTFTLLKTYDTDRIEQILTDLDYIVESNAVIGDYMHTYLNATRNAFEDVQKNPAIANRYKPTIHWYGASNQYHTWMFGDEPWFGDKKEGVFYHGGGFLRGDFGKSYISRRPVASEIWDAVSVTIWMSLISILITYLLSIPIGIFTARRKGKTSEKVVSTTLFMLYSMPNFWIGTMLIVFLCDPEYLDWFPQGYSFLEHEDGDGFFVRAGNTIYHLLLPMFVWTYASFAYISRQMRGGMLTTLGQDYIRTARAKGLSERSVIRKHALRNALIPIITIFASVFPLAISGAIVVEMIFSIKGMGTATLGAINAKDYPIVFTVIMFTGILTLVGTLVSDVLYAIVDPRISFSGKK